MHGFSFANYLAELGPDAQSEIYKKSSIDLALRDAFRKMRSFLMTTQGSNRGRGNLAHLYRGRNRSHPGGRRQLGHPCYHQESLFAGSATV